MFKFFEVLFRPFFPNRCAYCGEVIAYDELMCDKCQDSLPRIVGEICQKCGRGKEECNCKKAQRYYKRVVAPFYFTGNVRKGVHSFKFRRCPDNAVAYCSEMTETVLKHYSDVDFDFITSVPLTKRKLEERGYNQCELLAKGVSEFIGIEYRNDILIKCYETGNQHGLTHFMRKGNLTGVFDVTDPGFVKDKTILLCDDICTTGETLNECAKMLWLYDAKEIYCISLALTNKK